MDRNWSKWRVKQLPLCGMVINTTIPLVDWTLPHLKTPSNKYGSSATITSNIPQSPQISESVFWASMDIEILYFVRDWFKVKDFARVVASSRHLIQFGEGADGSIIHLHQTHQRQNLEYMRWAHRRLQSWHRRFLRAELWTKNKDFVSVNYQIYRTAVFVPHHSTMVTRTTSIMEPSLTDTIRRIMHWRHDSRHIY